MAKTGQMGRGEGVFSSGGARGRHLCRRGFVGAGGGAGGGCWRVALPLTGCRGARRGRLRDGEAG